MKLLKSSCTKNVFTIFFFSVLFLFLTFWRFKTPFCLTIVGLPLLFYFPGKFLLELIPALKFKFERLGLFSWSILLSFLYISLLGFILQKIFGFNSDVQIWGLLLTNLMLWIIYLFSNKNSLNSFSLIISRKDILTLVIIAVSIIITIITNPLVQDADGYLTLLIKSINENSNVELSRPLFIAFLNITQKFLSINLAFLYRNIFPALFFFFSLILYDYLKRNLRSEKMVALGFLSLLAPSVILSELNIIRPQVAMIALTIPVIIFSVESVRHNNILQSGMAMLISLLAILFHELSAILLFVSFLAFSVNIYRSIFIEKTIKPYHLLLFILFIFPYFKLFNLLHYFSKPLFMIQYALHFINNLSWRWWFINDYSTIDGANLGWPGIYALFYYMYNGLLLLILIGYLIFLTIRKKTKLNCSFFLPVTYFAIFFIIAEVLPRIGLYFLPNRAWVHLMIASVIIFCLLLEELENAKVKLKLLQLPLLSSILIGFCGLLYISINNVYTVYNEEIPAANFINKKTPGDSIIISSQDNSTLVNFYGKRKYDQITTDHVLNDEEFQKLINKKIDDLSKDKVSVLKPEIVQITETLKNGEITKRSLVVTQKQENLIERAAYNGRNSVYFLYSYRKLNGMNSQRSYRENDSDRLNRNTYQQLGLPIVYSNKDTVVLKIR